MYKFSRDVIFVEDRNPGFLQFNFQGSFVTVIWKTDHLDTRTKIHLLPVRDRHTHALSRNTKH